MPDPINPVDWAKAHKGPAALIVGVGAALSLALYKRATGSKGSAATAPLATTSSPSYAATTDGTVLSWQSPQGFNSGGLAGSAPTVAANDLGLPPALSSVASPTPVQTPVTFNAPTFGLPGEKLAATAFTPDHNGEYFLSNYGGVYTAGNAKADTAHGVSYLGLGPAGQQGDAAPGTPGGRQFNAISATPTGYVETDTAGEQYAFQTA